MAPKTDIYHYLEGQNGALFASKLCEEVIEERIPTWDHLGLGWALNSMVSVLMRQTNTGEKATWRQTQRLQLPNCKSKSSKESRKSPETGRGKGFSPRPFWEEQGPADTLSLGFWPPELGETFCRFKPLGLWPFVKAAQGHEHTWLTGSSFTPGFSKSAPTVHPTNAAQARSLFFALNKRCTLD